jgi:hypothetical protein
LGDNINTLMRNGTPTDTSKEVGLEDVNTEKTKYMLMSFHQTAGQILDPLKMWQVQIFWKDSIE